jgi:hypothetical protein
MDQFPDMQQPGHFLIAGLPEPGRPAEMADPKAVVPELFLAQVHPVKLRTCSNR